MSSKAKDRNFLKYGEHMLLANYQHKIYLANRGTTYQAGYFARCSQADLVGRFQLYPNLLEIVFEVHPNLNYEALTEYSECSNNDPNKEILEKRMILESNLNNAKIEENRGKYVKLGSVVQLYHPNSKTYISFSSQKIGKSDLAAIGCSPESNESVQFTISSPFDFLKEGSLISYEDKFLFSDAYNKTLAFTLSEEELEGTKMELEVKVSSGLFGGFFGRDKQRRFKLPAIIENQKLYSGYFAGSINEKSIGKSYGNQFEAIDIQSLFESNELKDNDLKWGDIINIRKVDNSGKYSLMSAEVNKSSLDNALLYRTFSQDSASKMVNLESQFQLVHINMKTAGTTVTFDKFNSVKVLLKHVISGKFLCIDPETHKLVLGKDFQEEYDQLVKNSGKLEDAYKESYQKYMIIKEAKKFDEITKKDAPNLTQADIDFFQTHGEKLIQSNKDFYEAYIRQRSFILEKVSSDESIHLNNSTFLKLRTFRDTFLSVQPDPTYIAKSIAESKASEDSEYFESNFFENMAKELSQEMIVESDACDIFHLEKTDKNLFTRFSRMNSYAGFIASMLLAPELKQSTTLQYISVIENITVMLHKIISKKKLTKHVAQYMMVQISLVDLLMEYLIKAKSVVRDNDDHVRLLVEASSATLNLLSLICEGNTTVCHYVFQWRKLFTASIVKMDSVVFRQVNIDSLLFSIVDTLKCYTVYIDDYLTALCSSIRFESLDIKKLTVLIQITKNFESMHVDKVFDKIFSDNHDIFKNLTYDKYDNSKIVFTYGKEVVEVDQHFMENEQIYNYFLQTLNLAVHLGELDSAKTAKHLQDAFPKDICIAIITNNFYPGEFRATFLKLFALIFIVNLFQNNSMITYEELITSKARSNVRRVSEVMKTLDSLKDSDENKRFLQSLLNNLTSPNNELAQASLQIFNLLLSFKFFEKDYVDKIKESFECLIIGDHSKLNSIESNTSMINESILNESAGKVFKFEDPATLLEVIEMLTKLHTTMLRNRVVGTMKKSVISEGEKSPGENDTPEVKEENAFKQAFGSDIGQISGRYRDIWRVVTAWISHNDARLTSAIIKYVYDSSMMRKMFAVKYADYLQIEGSEDEQLYLAIRGYLTSFSGKLRDLMSEYTTSDSKTIRERTNEVFRGYQDLFDSFYTVMHPNDRESKFELCIKDNRRQTGKDIYDINSQETYMNLLNMFLIDCKRLKSKQNIILKSGMLEIVMKTAICFNTKIFVSFSRLEIETVEKPRFDQLPEFKTRDTFKDEINLILLLILYYSIMANPDNVDYLMNNYRADLFEFILSQLNVQNIVIKRVTLTMMVELYHNNIDALLRLRNDDREFFDAILRQSQQDLAARRYDILLNYIEWYNIVSHFNSAILEENAKDIFNCLFDDSLTDSSTTLTHLIYNELGPELAQNFSSLDKATKLNLSKTKAGVIFSADHLDQDDMDERNNIFSVFEISNRLLFINQLLALIASFGKQCSADLKNKMQKKLSMHSLLELAGQCKYNYKLKATLVDVISHVFVTTKIDQSSKSYLLELISSVFNGDLKDYFKSQSNTLTTIDVYFINKTPKVSCLLLDKGKKRPTRNLTVLSYDYLLCKFVSNSMGRLIDKFVRVCANENSTNLLESIFTMVDDLECHKERVEKLYLEAPVPRGNTNQSAEDIKISQLNMPAQEGDPLTPKQSMGANVHAFDSSPFGSPTSPQKGLRRIGTPTKFSEKRTKNLSHRKGKASNEDDPEEFETIETFLKVFTEKFSRLIAYFRKEKHKNAAINYQDDYFRLVHMHSTQKKTQIDRDESDKSTFFLKLTEAILISQESLEVKRQREASIMAARKQRRGTVQIEISPDGSPRKGVKYQLGSLEDSPNHSSRDVMAHGREISPTNKGLNDRARKGLNLFKVPNSEVNDSPAPILVEPRTARNLNRENKKDTDNAVTPRTSVQNLHLEQEKHGLKGNESPPLGGAMPSKNKVHKQIPPPVINLVSEKYIQINNKELSVSSKKAKDHIDFDNFQRALESMVKIVLDNQVHYSDSCLIIEYLAYCLDCALLKEATVDVLHKTESVKSIVMLLLTTKDSLPHMVQVVKLLNKLVKVDLKFQLQCSDIFYKDQDNKLVNMYFTKLHQVHLRLVEVEEVDRQFTRQKDKNILELAVDTLSDEKREVAAQFKVMIAKLSDDLVADICEILKLPQLLCMNHNSKMQNFLRLQSVHGHIRPMQFNVFDNLKDILKGYLKIMRSQNLSIAIAMFTLLTKLVEGPCKENQYEIISKKIIGVLDEAYSSIYQMTDKKKVEEKSQAMLEYLRLKLGVIEGTSDSLIIKTIGLAFNSEVFWSRLEQLYCILLGLKSFSSYNYSNIQPLGPEIQSAFMGGLTTTSTAVEKEKKPSKWSNARKVRVSSMSEEKDLINSKIYDGQNYSTLMREGLYIIIWINQMCELEPSIVLNVKTTQDEMVQIMRYLKPAAKFFQERVTNVEIINSMGDLQTLYFYTHPLTRFLSSHTKSTFENSLDRRSWNSKLIGLTDGVEILYYEMKHFEYIYSKCGIHANLSFLQYIKIACFCIAILLNLIILFSKDLTAEIMDETAFRQWNRQGPNESLVYILGIILLSLYSLILLLWMIFEFNIKRQIFYSESSQVAEASITELRLLTGVKSSKKIKIWETIKMHMRVCLWLGTKTNLLVYMLYMLLSVMGLSVSKFYFSFLLLDIVSLSPQVWSVFKSLTLNYSSLGGTAVFALILIFIYTSFTYFYEEVLITNLSVIDQNNVVFCDTFTMCYLNMITFGLRSGGGIGDMLELPSTNEKQNFIVRQLFDLIFFITVILLLMNIVLGIIIDSFAELRDWRARIGKLRFNIRA